MATKYCKLVMVTAENNNKFYIMEEKNGTLHIEYGRVDSTSTKLTKPMSKWDSIYNEKTKKGYKDVTDFVTEKTAVDDGSSKKTDDKLDTIKDIIVDKFLNLMRQYTDGLVKQTYTVTYKSVTQAQVDQAQGILDGLQKLDPKKHEKQINQSLIDLYTIIPRYMGKVQHYLLPSIDFEKHLVQEQDNLDAMESQVKMYAAQPKVADDKPKQQTMLDVLGVQMVTSKTNPDIQYLVDQVGGRNRIEAIFDIAHPREDARFDKWMSTQKNKQTRILIHGTRCSSVIPIIKTSLQIRPTGNFQFSGKVYGDGSYFSEVVQKSLNYTGYDPDKILLVYEVQTGNPFIYDGWFRGNSFPLDFKNLKDRGYDSTYVKAGHGLLNTEIIAYHEHQYCLRHILWLK